MKMIKVSLQAEPLISPLVNNMNFIRLKTIWKNEDFPFRFSKRERKQGTIYPEKLRAKALDSAGL